MICLTLADHATNSSLKNALSHCDPAAVPMSRPAQSSSCCACARRSMEEGPRLRGSDRAGAHRDAQTRRARSAAGSHPPAKAGGTCSSLRGSPAKSPRALARRLFQQTANPHLHHLLLEREDPLPVVLRADHHPPLRPASYHEVDTFGLAGVVVVQEQLGLFGQERTERATRFAPCTVGLLLMSAKLTCCIASRW